MPKNSSQLSGQIGENLVVAELGRRGIIATANIGAIAIQVKAFRFNMHIIFSNEFNSLGGLEVNRIIIKTSALISTSIKSKIV